MRSLFLLAMLGLSQASPAQQPTADAIAVRVDPRIELLSIVFRLAGNPEYSQGRLETYNRAVDTHFAAHADHAVVQQAKALRNRRGVSYDAVASLAIHLEGIDPPRFATKDQRPERLEARWPTSDANLFLQNLGDFVRDAKVPEFLASQKELYAHAEAQMQKVAADHVDMSWFGKFFGERPKARFQVVLGLLNGPGNFGPSAKAADGSEDLYAILGCWQVDAKGLPTYDKKIVPTLVHEYCHSYCNPVVDEHYASLAKAGNALFAMTQAAMKSQAYANGRTLLCESLVRACVVRYRATVEGDQAAAEEIQEQNRCSFLWTGDLAALLAADYETNRKDFPTLRTFDKPLAAFFAAAGTKLQASLAKAPKVVSIAPDNGSKDVDPAVTALVVTFDRPMQDRVWSVVGGGEHFPEITGKLSYDKDRKVLTIPIKVKAEWSYELWLNSGKHNSFRSEDGTPLQPVHVQFATRKL